MYEYEAVITDVYDGDTVTATVDLGFDHHMGNTKLRLLGIDTPELRGGTARNKKKAREARDYLRSLILGNKVLIRTVRDTKGKYGRYLAIIFLRSTGCNVNLRMVEGGFAKPYGDEFEDLSHEWF